MGNAGKSLSQQVASQKQEQPQLVSSFLRDYIEIDIDEPVCRVKGHQRQLISNVQLNRLMFMKG